MTVAPSPTLSFTRGVTLIELVVVIALSGILVALIVNFAMPVRSYIDVSRRAALADAADTALRRIGRDLHLALPNSVRVDGTGKYVEFLLVRTGGRYRSETDPGASNTCAGGFAKDVLAFTAADDCFKTIGNIPDIAAVTGTDRLVVFNLPPDTDKASAYQTTCGAACNWVQVASATAFAGEDRIQFSGANTFTYESPGNRFYIIEGAVTYGCDTGAGTLRRYSGYAISDTQTAPPGGSSALLATGVKECSFTYDSSAASTSAGLVTMRLKLETQVSGGATESVTLHHAVHVNNVP